MTKVAVKNKGWTVTFAGMGINLSLGVLYAWSVIKKAIPAEWGWDDADKALPYSIACITFALMTVPAGRLQDRIGPRWVATAGGILTGAGCIIASYATTVLWYVLGFGLLAGAGIGLGYAAATPPAVKWFPARKTGLIAGIVVAGFGLASVYISPLANYFTGYNLAGKPHTAMEELIQSKTKADGEFKAAQAALTTAKADPARAAELSVIAQAVADKEAAVKAAGDKLLALKEGNIQKTLLIFGIGFLIVVTILSQLMFAPPAGYSPPDAAAAASAGRSRRPGEHRPNRNAQDPALLPALDHVRLRRRGGTDDHQHGHHDRQAREYRGRVHPRGAPGGGQRLGPHPRRDALGQHRPPLDDVHHLRVPGGPDDGPPDGPHRHDRVHHHLDADRFQLRLLPVRIPVRGQGQLRTEELRRELRTRVHVLGVGGSVLPFIAGKFFETAKKATGTGSYDNAYLMAAGLLVLAAILTFVTRGIEKRHKAATAA